jgi:DNA repair protein RadC
MTKVIPFQPNVILSQFKATEIEITYRNRIPYEQRIPVRESRTAYELLWQAWDLNKIELQEQFKILLLDQQAHCLGIADIGTGGIASCVADPRLIFTTALKARASSIILAHNHPSGSLKPSDADLALTRKLVEGGRLLDLTIFDHLIMTPERYCSFADEGLMPR